MKKKLQIGMQHPNLTHDHLYLKNKKQNLRQTI